MKKFIIIILFIILSGILISEEVVKGIRWDMSRQEIKKVLSGYKILEETSEEITYKSVTMKDSNIGLHQVMDEVAFTFENGKLIHIQGVIARALNNENIETFSSSVEKCKNDYGSEPFPATEDDQVIFVNLSKSYGCGLGSYEGIIDMYAVYFNPGRKR